MKKMMIALSLVAIMVLGAISANAFGPGYGPRGKGGGPCWGGPESGKTSSLTPDQQTKLQGLRQKFADETAKLRETLLVKKQEMQSLWSSANTEDKAIVEKDKELRDLQNQMRDKRLQFKLEARQFLTPDQIAGFGPGAGMGPGFGRGQIKGRGMGPGRGPCF